MLDLDEALAAVLAKTPDAAPRPAEAVALAACVGRILAEDVRSDLDLPPFPRATMDGVAIAAADAAAPGATLRVAGESAAGRPFGAALHRGCAVRISTGAALPAGADAVVMVERVRFAGGSVILEDAARAGQNVAAQGEDLRRGAVAAAAGTPLSTGHVGLLASVGAVELPCLPQPRVAILATGTELVAPEELPGPGRIRESNGVSLAALVRRAGGVVMHLERVHDDAAAIRAAAARGLAGADLLLLSGGSSVGEHDHTPRVLAELGVSTHFDRVALKPGKPTIFGTRGAATVFGLPGNPVSAMVVFHLLVRPALLVLAGRTRGQDRAAAAPPWLAARLRGTVTRVRARDQALPATLHVARSGSLEATFAGWHGSGDLTALARATALLLVPRGDGALADGALVRVTPLDGARAGDLATGFDAP